MTTMIRLVLYCLAATLVLGCGQGDPPVAHPSVPVAHRSVMIIDAGSSGSRLYHYALEPNPKRAYPKVSLIKRYPRIEVGVHNGINAGLYGLLQQAARDVKPVVPLRLMATAGLREVRDSDFRRFTEQSIERLMGDFGFANRRARVISGETEAYYAWLTANYAVGRLDGSNTLGVVEMGGASVQIAFADPSGFSRENRNLVLHSAAGCGKERIKKQVGNPAVCYPGDQAGDYRACRSAVSKSLTGRAGQDRTCRLSALKTGVTPKGEFAAVSNYYHTANALLGMKKMSNFIAGIDALRTAAESYCADTWGAIMGRLQTAGLEDSAEYYRDYCLMAAYIDVVLVDGYGFADDAQFMFVDEYPATNRQKAQFGDSWTLGAAIDFSMTGATGP